MEELDILEDYCELLTPNRLSYRKYKRINDWIEILRMLVDQELNKRKVEHKK